MKQQKYYYSLSQDNQVIAWEACKCSLDFVKLKSQLLAADLGLKKFKIEICILEKIAQLDAPERIIKKTVWEMNIAH